MRVLNETGVYNKRFDFLPIRNYIKNNNNRFIITYERGLSLYGTTPLVKVINERNDLQTILKNSKLFEIIQKEYKDTQELISFFAA